MRRRAAESPPPPERLVRFVDVEWSEVAPDERWGVWCAARRAYVAEHPDGALGSVLDELRGRFLERRRLTAAGEW